MKRSDCIVDCVGPDCEGCKDYKTAKSMKANDKKPTLELKEQIKEILDKYCVNGPYRQVQIAEEIDKLYHSEDKLDKIDKRGGWICPRCQKVHSWLSMTCDCPPNVITASTIESKEVTEIKGENNCDNCKWGICTAKDWPCNDCNGSNKWEPINE